MIATAAIPTTAFDLSPGTWTYNEATLMTELPNLPQDNFFPYTAPNTANTEELRTRYLMYLPAKYAALLLSSRGYTAKQAWDILQPAIEANNEAGPMQPILNWLRITLHASHINNQGPPTTAFAITAPCPDEDLILHREPYLTTFLPGRAAAMNPGLDTAIAQMATAVSQQVAETRTTRLSREIKWDQPTLPSAKFGLLLDSLLNYLNVTTEQELPEFWFYFAATPKKQEFSILRNYLEGFSRTNAAFVPISPVPSPKLLADLTAVTFVGDHLDDLKTGIQPFIAMDGSEEHRLASLEISRNFGLLLERDFSMAFQDLSKFKTPKDLRSYPLSFFDLERNLGIFGNLLVALLGDRHPLSYHFRLFWNAFTHHHRLTLQHEIDTRRYIKPVHILRNIQLICYNWFLAKHARQPPMEPNFTDILHRISLANYTTPLLPQQLYQLVTPPKTPNIGGHVPPPANTILTPSHPSGLTAITDDASMTGSAISGLTQNTGLKTSTSKLSGRAGTLVVNPSQDPHLASLIPFNKRIKDLMGTTNPPNTDDGTPICLSFHLKGGCYTNCRRAANHAHTLTASEKGRLENYVADRLAATP